MKRNVYIVQNKPAPQEKKKISKFRCLEKNRINTLDILQGIEYPNGICAIGVDVWRNLDKHDCSSHEVLNYPNKETVKRYYNLVAMTNNTLIS